VNKTELIEELARRFDGNKKAAAEALDAVLDTITREVAKGEKVSITGFGTFEKRVREARSVRNPRTGAPIRLKKTSVPKFRAGAELKDVVSGSKKLPKLTTEKKKPKPPRPGPGPGPGTGDPGPLRSRKSTAKKAPAKKAAAKATTATKSTAAKKAPAKKAAKKTTAKKTTTKKAPTKRTVRR
jgi:DNA-binding protein HU-beta